MPSFIVRSPRNKDWSPPQTVRIYNESTKKVSPRVFGTHKYKTLHPSFRVIIIVHCPTGQPKTCRCSSQTLGLTFPLPLVRSLDLVWSLNRGRTPALALTGVAASKFSP